MQTPQVGKQIDLAQQIQLKNKEIFKLMMINQDLLTRLADIDFVL